MADRIKKFYRRLSFVEKEANGARPRFDLQDLQPDELETGVIFFGGMPQVSANSRLREWRSLPSWAFGAIVALRECRRELMVERIDTRDRLPMGNRRTTLLWMRDLLEHLSTCHEQLHWAADGPAEAFLTEAMMADLSECRRLCEQIRQKPANTKALLAH